MNIYTESVFLTGGIFAIASIGLYVTLASGQFSVAHAALMGLGGYGAAIAAVEFGLPFWLTIIVGSVIGGLAGTLMGILVRNMRGMLLGVATLAIGEAISLTVANIDYLGAGAGYRGVPLRTDLTSVLLILGVLLAALSYLGRTRFGLALIAVGKDKSVAEALGISTRAVRIWAFGVGGGIAGLAGGLLAQFVGLVKPTDLAFTAEIQLFVFLIVGGLSTPWGPVLGAMGITWILEALRFSPLDRFWILGLILVIVVVIKPEGILVRRNLRLQATTGRFLSPSKLDAVLGSLAGKIRNVSHKIKATRKDRELP